MKYIYRMGTNTTKVFFKPLGELESVEPGNNENYLIFYIYCSFLHVEEMSFEFSSFFFTFLKGFSHSDTAFRTSVLPFRVF